MIKEFWNIKKPCGFVLEFLDSQKNTRVNQPQHKCRGFFLGLKKAQASDFMTWIITTLAIIVFISIVIFFVNFSFLKDAKVENYNSVRTSDFVVGESLLAYARTQEPNGEIFYYGIKSLGNLDETKDNGKIAGLIFKNLYPEYSDAWFGYRLLCYQYYDNNGFPCGNKGVKPFDFIRPNSGVWDHLNFKIFQKSISVQINFEKEKFLEFVGRQK